MASTNFLQFDEAGQNMMSDGDYEAHVQRARGVTPGIAYPNLHNKLYYQVSTMCKAFADFMVQQGQDAQDGDIEQLTTNIANAINSAIEQSNRYVPLTGGIMTGLLSLFTGSTVSTPSSDDNSKKIPNTEWVQDYIDNFLVGNIIYRAFLQNGYVKLNGATVQREDYPRLVQYATTNSLFTADNTTTPWLFGNGDGEITFVLPDYRNLFIVGGDTPSKIEAGLPNITGIFFDLITNVSGKMGNGTGCFNTLPESVESGISTINSNAFTNTGATKDGISLDASRSSSIYGASTTVQPPAIILIPQIKY